MDILDQFRDRMRDIRLRINQNELERDRDSVRINFVLDASTAALIASASSGVAASGLSQITVIPAFKNAIVGPACKWFGVTIATASMPSGRAASTVAISA